MKRPKNYPRSEHFRVTLSHDDWSSDNHRIEAYRDYYDSNLPYHLTVGCSDMWLSNKDLAVLTSLCEELKRL